MRQQLLSLERRKSIFFEAAVYDLQIVVRSRMKDNNRAQSASKYFRFFMIVTLVFCIFLAGETKAGSTPQVEEGRGNIILITLGTQQFRLPPPVYLDGKWVNNDAKGRELSFSIRAAELFKKFDPSRKPDQELLDDAFRIYLFHSEVDEGRKAKNEMLYSPNRKLDEMYRDETLGLWVYKAAPQFGIGWGSPTFYPLDKNYVAPDGGPFRITCHRIKENLPPHECRFQYFIEGDIQVTFNFLRADKNLKYWRELDQALRQTLKDYKE